MTKSSYGSQISAEDDNEFEFDVKPSTATEYKRTKKGLCTPTFIVMTLLTIVVIAVLICVVILGLLSTFDVISLDTLDDDDDDEFFAKVRVENIKNHLQELEDIAKLYGNTRAAGTMGYNKSVEYVRDQLKVTNYVVSEQPFSIVTYKEESPSTFRQLTPFITSFTSPQQFSGLSFQGSGNVTSSLAKAADHGCSEKDYDGITDGQIVVIARGTCSFAEKVGNATSHAGAIGVLIYNYESENSAFSGTLGSPVSIPVLGISYSVATELIAGGGNVITNTTAFDLPSVSVEMISSSSFETLYTMNLIADTPDGSSDSIIVQGSHLDSVPAGPGINDNGSGSSTNLEIALEFFRQNISPKNKVRFAWWGAEELGLLGSKYYVQSLSADAKKQIALNLNYDMLGSPNFARAILNGSEAAAEINTASTKITQLYQEFFQDNDISYKLNPFTGRSDYGSFLDASIPAGGLQTGAEVQKTDEERSSFGGLAKTAFDPCYHQSCDTLENINFFGLNDMAHAAAYVLEKLATESDLVDFLSSKD